MMLLQTIPVLPDAQQITTVVVLFVFAWFFWKKIGEQDKRIENLNNRVMDMNGKLLEVLTKNTDVLERVENKLEKVK